MCGKLGKYLVKQGKKPLLVACDIYRPAAIQQLKVVAGKAEVGFFEMGQKDPVKIAKEAVEYARSLGYDTVILDTAGRLHINEELMQELKNVKAAVSVTEILLTVDAMTGQDAVTVAKAFDEALGITGVIMTKLDGDTRGGATLSIKAVTGKPIKFCGTGEKTEDIEPFYPDRMASRILGMGDVLTLIDKAQAAISEEQAEKMAKRMQENSFDLNDFVEQFDSLSKMGDLNEVMGMMPGFGRMKVDKNAGVDKKEIGRIKAIVRSMTAQERKNPKILNYSRRRRIAAGSGTTVADVNKVIKKFEQMKELIKQYSGKKGEKLMKNFRF